MSITPYYDATGHLLLRAADVTANIEEALQASPEWGPEAQLAASKALAQLVQPFSYQLGLCYDLVQAVIDARRRVSAEGVHLDNLGGLVGVPRQEATYSTVTATFTGADTSPIPAGTRFRASGSAVNWETTEAGVISGSTGSVPARCQTIGAQEASAGSLDTLVDTPTGITAVSNAAAAETGDEAESDSVYRRRIKRSLSAGGTARPAAIRAALEKLSFITAASVIENLSATETDAKGIPPISYRPVVLPGSLTTAQEQAIALAIWLVTPAGIRIDGSESYTVTDDQGYEQPIAFSYGTPVENYITIRIYETDEYPSDGDSRIAPALRTFDNDYSLGSTTIPDDIRDYLREEVPGIQHMEIWLTNDGTTPTSADTLPLTQDVDEYPYFDANISVQHP
jgi:hypothetical protein